MPYRFKRSESVNEAVQRIAREEIGSAVQILHGIHGSASSEAIHEARKSIKKTRALLRLVRPELGKRFAIENARLRDVGRKLSTLRDANALIDTLDSLNHGSHQTHAKRSAAPIRHVLVLQKREVEEQTGSPQVMRQLAAGLARSRKSARQWRLDTDGYPAIAAGVEETFRAGKKALARVHKRGRIEDFHEWRKRVKDHWYQVRLLEKLWSDVMEGYEHSLKELENALGEDHNLAVLRERILSASKDGQAGSAVDALTKAIDATQKDLRAKALEIGEKVYSVKPRQFARQMRRLWKTWRG